MGNSSSQHFDYSNFVNFVSRGLTSEGLAARDQRIIDEFIGVIRGTLVNDPLNPELPWPSQRGNWSEERGIREYLNRVELTLARQNPVKISDFYYQLHGAKGKTFTKLQPLTQKQLAHFYTAVLLLRAFHQGEDLSKMLQNSDFLHHVFNDGMDTDYHKIDRSLKLLEKIAGGEKEKGSRHFVKRTDLQKSSPKPEVQSKEHECAGPSTLEEYLNELLYRTDVLIERSYLLEEKLDFVIEQSSLAEDKKRLTL